LGDLEGVCEDLMKCDAKLKSILLGLKLKEGSLKVFNDEFGAMWKG